MSAGRGLLALLLLAGCRVDPAALQGFPEACDATGRCASGYSCEAGRCVRPAGGHCDAQDATGSCERSTGVCAQAVRACVEGQVESTCSAASYGEDFEAQETRCDGLDNDCDGVADAQLWPLGDATHVVLPQLLVRARGYAAVSLELSGTLPRTWALRYDALREDFGWAGAPLYLQAPLQAEDAVQVQVAAGPAQAVLLWHAMPPQGAPHTRLARVAHPVEGVPSLAAGPVTLVPPEGALAAPRIALAADGESVLVAWGTTRGVLLQAYSAALEPIGALRLLAPAPRLEEPTRSAVLDVAPRGASGFAVGWASDDAAGSAVHLRGFPGEEARTLSTTGTVSELRLLSALDGDVRAAWLRRSAEGAAGVDWAEPFGTAPPASALELAEAARLVRLDARLDPRGALVLTYPRAAAGAVDVVLRTVSPQGPVHEQLLATGVPFWTTQLAAADGGGRLLATTLREGRPWALRTCALP